MTTEQRRPSGRRGAAALGVVGLLAASLLSTNGPSALLSSAHGSPGLRPVSTFDRASQPQPLALQLVDTEPAVDSAPANALTGSPESRLIAVYRLIAGGRLGAALQAADALCQAFPAFRLAQLVRADLMSARFGTLSDFGTAPPYGAMTTSAAAASAELALLRDEARLRLQALQERPPRNAIPSEFVSLHQSIRYAIAVDTSRARLYLFENNADGPHWVEDFYVSVGRQGVGKLKEGDQKTPLGVYFITDRLGPRSLQERFGAGALPLNYPNAYDKLRGRTGSGILLHGVPSNTYSRPPLDSDGCVAMANDDLQRLAALLPQRDTPVIITRQIHWVDARDATAATGTGGLMRAVAEWQRARLQADRDNLRRMYETPRASSDSTFDVAQTRQPATRSPAGFADLSVLTWHDDPDKMVVTFRELAAQGDRHDHLMRQYWERTGEDWRIVAEGSVR